MSLQEAKRLTQEREAKEEAAEVKRYRRSLTFKVINSDSPLNTRKLRGFATHMLQRMQLTTLLLPLYGSHGGLCIKISTVSACWEAIYSSFYDGFARVVMDRTLCPKIHHLMA